jgi:Xaa-Pro aminopeptidase
MKLPEIQRSLARRGLAGWLLFDFRGSNPIARRIAGIAPASHMTRRWFGWIPAEGEPVWLHHAIEPHFFRAMPGRTLAFTGWKEMESSLRETLPAGARIAMEYSPGGAVPYVSRADAGTVEMIRALGALVESSADLVQEFEARWGAGGLASHRRAAAHLEEMVRLGHAEIARRLGSGGEPWEADIQAALVDYLERHDLEFSGPPIVAAEENAGNPHYEPAPGTSRRIRRNEVVLLDLWCREKPEGSIYADITWMGFTGREVPARVEEVWRIVSGARDEAVRYLTERAAEGDSIRGADVDDACRAFIASRGYGGRFLHRTGHSIGGEVHGNGANIDNLETRDDRTLLPDSGFSIEPGIYLPEFGVRSEIDVYYGERGPEVTTTVQKELVRIVP